jgi:hypothetical protein
MKQAAIFLGIVLLLSRVAVDASNELPKAAQDALNSPESVMLYSLEPWTENPDDQKNWKGAKFHYYICLGQTALTGDAAKVVITEFRKAIPEERGPMAMCFDPRHALSIVSNHHTYDFLLCFQCAQMEICEDEKEIANLSASGSADVLNGILKKAGIPLSHVYSGAYIKKEQAERDKRDADWKSWIEAAPGSLRPFLTNAASAGITFGNDPEKELSKEIQDERMRILVLLGWFGAGAGPWTGFSSYEEQPEELLLRYPTAKIVSAIQSTSLTDAQLEGAARLFAGWDFSQARPNDLKTLPPELKKALLVHTLKSPDTDKVDRAKHAFE